MNYITKINPNGCLSIETRDSRNISEVTAHVRLMIETLSLNETVNPILFEGSDHFIIGDYNNYIGFLKAYWVTCNCSCFNDYTYARFEYGDFTCELPARDINLDTDLDFELG